VSAFVDQRKGDFGVEPICRTLGVSASAYYERRSARRSERALEDERLTALIESTHAENYHAYGYRRMWKALGRVGEAVGRGRVQRLMRAAGIEGAKRRGKPWRTTTPDPGAHRRPDLVERDFSAAGPNELWVADLTLPALLGGPRVLRVRHRRVQPPGRRLAVRRAHAHRSRARRALNGASPARPRRRSRARAPLRSRQSVHLYRLHPRSSETTGSWPQSGRSAMPMTTPWPRASSTPSRPS
jgi:hypothetical protein